MEIDQPTFIAIETIVWLQANNEDVLIQACIGQPYEQDAAWTCPAALIGVDGRYPDIVGDSSMQALQLALRLIRQRLGHLLEAGEILAYPADRDSRWDIDSLNAVFGLG
ncbi:MAG: hypothetical protein V4484_18420 [Pseudomonadota bacterium]